MTSITIPTIWNKTEEKQFLDRLQKAFESSDTYLQEFFTKDLVESLKMRISNDFPCDYHADLEAWKDRCDELNKKLPEMEEKLFRAEVTIRNLMANIESKQAEIDSLVVKHTVELQKKDEEIARLQKQANDEYTEKMSLSNEMGNIQFDLDEAKVELGVKDLQIVELKAEVYDLTHKKQ
jgi:chromosome segregation ATPase